MQLLSIILVLLIIFFCCYKLLRESRNSSIPGHSKARSRNIRSSVTLPFMFDQKIKTSNDLLNDKISILNFDPVPIGNKINWSINPYNHPSWKLGLHSLGWLWPSIIAQKEGDDGHLKQVVKVIRDWTENNPRDNPPSDFSWNNHATAKRAHVIAAFYTLAPSKWLREALKMHVTTLADDDFYSGLTNHGIYQDIVLLMIGGILKLPDIMVLAEKRAAKAAKFKVDADGVLDEQSTAYQGYVLQLYKWYTSIAKTFSRPTKDIIPDLSLMEDVIVQMKMPDGTLAPIGDTYPAIKLESSNVAEGPGVSVYKAGYIFGRNGSKPDSTFYSLRFGPGRKIHGHDDHTSLYVYAAGQPRIIEGAHIGYERTAFRHYLKSPLAHNVVVVEGEKFNSENSTKLVEQKITNDWQLFKFKDEPYPDTVRERTARISFDPWEIVVNDRLTSSIEHTYQQLWHLPPGTKTVVSGSDLVATFKDGIRLRIQQIKPVDSINIVEGAQPYQGWVATGLRERAKAPVVVSSINGKKVEYHTKITLE